MEDYRTIRGTATGEYEEKKSRFIAQLSFADSEEKAVAFLEQVRAANRTARHNVYAYRLREGNRERYSDDGEPAKTAGTPALEVLQHSGLTDLVVVITRYFGGVLLGTGGLVRAYTTATARALEAAEVVTVRSVVELEVTVDYSLYERAALLIQAAGAKLAVHRPCHPALADARGYGAALAGAAPGVDPGRCTGERIAAVLRSVLTCKLTACCYDTGFPAGKSGERQQDREILFVPRQKLSPFDRAGVLYLPQTRHGDRLRRARGGGENRK